MVEEREESLSEAQISAIICAEDNKFKSFKSPRNKLQPVDHRDKNGTSRNDSKFKMQALQTDSQM